MTYYLSKLSTYHIIVILALILNVVTAFRANKKVGVAKLEMERRPLSVAMKEAYDKAHWAYMRAFVISWLTLLCLCVYMFEEVL